MEENERFLFPEVFNSWKITKDTKGIQKSSLVMAFHVQPAWRTSEGDLRKLEYDQERAIHVLDIIREWYSLEREAREKKLSFDERLAMGKEKIAA